MLLASQKTIPPEALGTPDRPRVSLLAGGMHAWINCFVPRDTMAPSRKYVEGFDPEMWCDGGPSQGGLVHVMDALWSQGGQKALSMALQTELESLACLRGLEDLAER